MKRMEEILSFFVHKSFSRGPFLEAELPVYKKYVLLVLLERIK